MTINLFEYVSKEKINKIVSETAGEDFLWYAGSSKIDFGSIEVKSFSTTEIASMVDHTILRADATEKDVRQLCEEALENRFASVCVNPSFLPLCCRLLQGSKIKLCTVVGFPLGANEISVKKYEAEQAINNGADEIDMVLNIGRLKGGDIDYVYKDIYEVVQTAKIQNRITKVIIETCYLSVEEKIKACVLAGKAGAEFVKTSTGFGPSGAKAEDVALMKYISGSQMKVKASGGIKTREDAELMISCGAERLGTSAGVRLIKEVVL
jgi:deoxyribose-phosphate aldolase